jgi:hypothetical protein
MWSQGYPTKPSDCGREVMPNLPLELTGGDLAQPRTRRVSLEASTQVSELSSS